MSGVASIIIIIILTIRAVSIQGSTAPQAEHKHGFSESRRLRKVQVSKSPLYLF